MDSENFIRVSGSDLRIGSKDSCFLEDQVLGWDPCEGLPLYIHWSYRDIWEEVAPGCPPIHNSPRGRLVAVTNSHHHHS